MKKVLLIVIVLFVVIVTLSSAFYMNPTEKVEVAASTPEIEETQQTVSSTPLPEVSTNTPAVPESTETPSVTQQPSIPYADPNMTGEIVPDMTVEEEIEIPLEENTSGGLM